MSFNKIKYLYLLILIINGSILLSCSDDEILPVEPSEETIGDVIHLTITLDKLGGSEASRATSSELEYLENYINPEKLRVLFFDRNDKFLFESKSRWIKQLDPSLDHSSWSVSIPLYSMGNDKDYDWDWEAIRTKLTTEEFKVAILANRPEREWNMGIEGKNNKSIVFVEGGWFGSTGPIWTKKNSVVYKGNDKDEKELFDLHHCQYDPIYHGKNFNNEYDGSPDGYGSPENANRYFYDFITKDVEGNPDRPYMGATSSWVEWGENDNIKDDKGWGVRKTRLPSEENPIPMYGIQKFSALINWKKGTSIDLPSDKPIALLRSVVKLELIVPSGIATDVVLFYPNIYARCEPMDVWTPTNEIWAAAHNSSTKVAWTEGNCEWKRIFDYGTIARFTDTSAESESKGAYQRRLGWFYGVWTKHGWTFNGKLSVGDFEKSESELPYPQVFNPCVQRNTYVYVEKTFSDAAGDHFVVYCGERNINDPSKLYSLGSIASSGDSPLLYWCIVEGKDENAYTYSYPIVDYANANKNNVTRKGTLKLSNGIYVPSNSDRAVGTKSTSGSNGNGMGEYLWRVMGRSFDSSNTSLRQGDNGAAYSGSDIPIPLLRNHVYRLSLSSSTAGSRSGSHDFNVQSEILATEDIGFGN